MTKAEFLGLVQKGWSLAAALRLQRWTDVIAIAAFAKGIPLAYMVNELRAAGLSPTLIARVGHRAGSKERVIELLEKKL